MFLILNVISALEGAFKIYFAVNDLSHSPTEVCLSLKLLRTELRIRRGNMANHPHFPIKTYIVYVLVEK